MIIDLSKSHLFTRDPGNRLSSKYDLPNGLWSLIYRRYKILDYSIDEICDLYELKTKKTMGKKNMRRWVWRTEVYEKAQFALKEGAHVVNSNYFGDMEWSVVKELTKNIKKSGSVDIKALP